MKHLTLISLLGAGLIASAAALAQTPASAGTAPMSAKEPKTQKEACQWEAKDKKLKGAELKAFMADCTSK